MKYNYIYLYKHLIQNFNARTCSFNFMDLLKVTFPFSATMCKASIFSEGTIVKMHIKIKFIVFSLNENKTFREYAGVIGLEVF